MKNTQIKSLLLTAAMTGLLSGAAPAFASSHATGQNSTSTASSSSASTRLLQAADEPEKHACKGKNSCKGQGGCKSGDNGCKGKNSCKGKGGCATDGSQGPMFT